MSEANIPVKIYKGEFFKNDIEEINVNGKISFDWVTNVGLYFSGKVIARTRTKRLARRMIRFSKCVLMHDMVIDLLINYLFFKLNAHL